MLLDDTTTVLDSTKDKDLPQLPPDDAWAQKTAGEINEMQLSGQESSQSFNAHAQDWAPPIPRRSSKRKSVLPNTFTPLSDSDTSQAAIINAKVKAMIDATAALKGSGAGKIHTGPYVPAKKRRIQDNKVIVKVRAAINERFNARNIRKRHDSARDDHLLDQSLNELDDGDDLSQSVSAMDIRLNEGNFYIS